MRRALFRASTLLAGSTGVSKAFICIIFFQNVQGASHKRPFVCNNQTVQKLKDSKTQGSLESKQLKLVCCMFELLLYALMMDKDDAIDDKLAYRQFLGPLTNPE